MKTLEIKDLHVKADDDKEIIKGFTYTFEQNKIYALIGPNGNGKSTLLSTIMGDPNYEITSGNIIFNNEDITEAEVDEKARKGIFLGMQYPSEIPGVKTLSLLQASATAVAGKEVSLLDVALSAQSKAKALRINEELIHRDLNVGFSGGEKKKIEILQMEMLKPKFIMLDEIDSGLDVDAIKAIAAQINQSKYKDNTMVIISHYKELYETIQPDVVLIIKDGKLFKEGDYSLLMSVLDKGFDL